jgi:glycosyltransferase involved in cell wall biosynthesis
VTYRFVDTLNAAGISAVVVHRSAQLRCTWFDNTTRVVGAKDVVFDKGDLLVIPEWYRSSIPRIAPGVPNLVFNQNTYETFTGVPRNANSNDPVVSADTIGLVVVSEDNQKYANLCFPGMRVDRIKLGIDTNVFHEAPEGKTTSIAYMPRKRLKELNQILHILQLRESLKGWTLRPIQGLSETETAKVLASSAIFLALNEREGFGLPPLEAMASGCAVVGFSGGVGLEYMRVGCAIPITDGDVTAFVLALESILARWGRDDSLRLMTMQAVDLAKREFSRESEQCDVLSVFGDAMDRVKTVEPRTRSMNWRLLRSPGSRIERLAMRIEGARKV